MMRIVALALMFCLAGATSAQAGAWLREKGKGFFSTTIDIREDNENSASLYVEYGLTDSITLGIDTNYDTDLLSYLQGAEIEAESLEELPQGTGVVFLRFPIGPTDQTNKFAFHVGLGVRYLNGEFFRSQEVGLSWGRGIKLGERYGWLNVDSSYNSAEDPARTRIKLDGTFGLGLTDRTKVMLQLFNTFIEDERFTKVAPSVLYTFGKRKTTLQLGSEIPVDGGDPSLKIGLWYEF